ncbi:MAG: glycine cleavage system aminomethyltransferase GcvT [Anaerolineales bacterium]|nr:glycine cleavage system aminomethyltransferase GcvT [Anaerolineales bacterium]
MKDFLFRGSLAKLDHAVFELAEIEAERQYRKLILIPSESVAPLAVREALASTFQNLYAEGYPDEDTRWMSQAELLDYPERLGHYRRYGDPRYYKGVEYVDLVEALARRRCAEIFATNEISADDLFVNVQPLSGAPANNAVYHALINPGDTIMGMNLFHGGHLTHGSPVNRSGKLYQAVHYTVHPDTEQLDYDAIEELASQHKPKIIVAGYSSYPWAVDWAKFRAIASSVGAVLLADIAHVAGMVVAGAYPSPLGYADVITFTTHKSLCGPRGACILTTDSSLASKLDKAVFPGEQGGPHVNTFAAIAVTFKLASTEQFRQLQHQIVTNARVFTEQLKKRGFRIPYGGTDTHLMNLDTKSVKGLDGTTLSGEFAARLLDIVGIVVNRNTIPGDTVALRPTGIRMGTPWVTQRGFKENDMVELANTIADLLQATLPYSQPGRLRDIERAKVDFSTLENIKLKVRSLAEQAGIDFGEGGKAPAQAGYPHFYYLDDDIAKGTAWGAVDIVGDNARQFLNFVLSSDLEALKPGESQATRLFVSKAEVDGTLTCLTAKELRLSVSASKIGMVAAWLRDLSDGYVAFDEDPLRKLHGPVVVLNSTAGVKTEVKGDPIGANKPYFIGQTGGSGKALPKFSWAEAEQSEKGKPTPITELHRGLGAKMVPFAGWEMPVWYSSVIEEHQAVRQAAGIFDVTHMGVYQAEGPDACAFLDCVCANDVGALAVGESHYTHFIDPDAKVIDDLLVYRRGPEKYLFVVNAANDDKDWAWLQAVKDGTVRVDNERPWTRAYGRNVSLRNLRDPKSGADMRVDVALQGPQSRTILLALGCNEETRKRVMKLKRTELCEAVIGGFDLVVSRTGYTGEKMAFELFVHPNKAATLFKALLKVGETYGLKPCGLGARDSLRTEAGLPLYGHEMGGQLNLGVSEAGFGPYVKIYKPWFIGRSAFLAREKDRQGVVVRFQFPEKGVRVAHLGDPVLDKRGKVIGTVTSCAIDQEGTLTGQAYVELKYAEENISIYIYQGAPNIAGKAPAELKPGDKCTLPTSAVVIRRFPK